MVQRPFGFICQSISAVHLAVNNLVDKLSMSRGPAQAMELHELWSQVKARFSSQLKLSYARKCLEKVYPIRLVDSVLELKAESAFMATWISRNYEGILRSIVREVVGQEVEIRFIAPDCPEAAESCDSEQTATFTPQLSPVKKQACGVTSANGGKTSSQVHNSDSAEEALGFNPNYRFDTFIVGPNSEFAWATAKAVAEMPGRSYNPVFIYGKSGVGKTHLLHAIGNHITTTRPRFRVVYITAERFTNEYINAIQENRISQFRQRYRSVDVLLVDDIEFLARKERIQEEFFHTFNALYEEQRQIVLTCDRPSRELRDIEARLVSRFEWGLVADLQPPDFETRVAILKAKQAHFGVTLPDKVLIFIAENIDSDVRALEGALASIAARIRFSGLDVRSEEAVREAIQNLIDKQRKPQITIELIQQEVADYFKLRVSDLTGKRRQERIVYPRHLAMYLARELTNLSYTAIAEGFGGRDHGTVLHACREIAKRMDVEKRVREDLDRLRMRIRMSAS